ncbi:hypothetical protein C8R46DRAFT_1144096 [Mycena filopes]|nr:hypothetical protein C8R46DRAFT_1144096 [Mycena filopes]
MKRFLSFFLRATYLLLHRILAGFRNLDHSSAKTAGFDLLDQRPRIHIQNIVSSPSRLSCFSLNRIKELADMRPSSCWDGVFLAYCHSDGENGSRYRILRAL